MKIQKSKQLLLTLAFIIVGSACQSTPPEKSLNSDKQIAISEPQVTTFNWLQPEFTRWAFQNMDSIFATAKIAKGTDTNQLARQPVALDSISIEQENGQQLLFQDHLRANHTDGLLVLHKGNIIAEQYFGEMQEETLHNWFSMSKSFTALIVGILVAEGKIELDKPTLHYLPWLANTAWQNTTVQMVMDMTVGLGFKEDYDNPLSDIYQFARASRFLEFQGLPSQFNSVPDYLSSVKQNGAHDQAFHYVSLNTEVLGLIITEVTGLQPSKLMSERIWAKLGTESDAYIVEDPNGLDLVSAAVNSTLRDAGRFGQMMLDKGRVGEQQIIPIDFIEDTIRGGSPEKFKPSKRGAQHPGFSYKNQFWHTDSAAYFAKGLYGQWIYIDPDSDLVVVKFASTATPSPNWTNDLRLIQNINRYLADKNTH